MLCFKSLLGPIQLLLVMTLILIGVNESKAQNLRSGGHGTSGGGGVRTSEGVTTFFRAKQIQTQSVQVDKIHAYRQLETLVRTSQMFSRSNRAKMLAALIQDGPRQYYTLSKTDLDQEVYRAIVHSYAELTGFGDDEIVIFAVTDKKERQTFLLPEFFELSSEEQTTVLFHELLWLVLPDLTYAEMLNIEDDFQLATLFQDLNAQVRMADRFGSRAQQAALRYKKDQLNGYVGIQKSKMIVDDISYYFSPELFLGKPYLACRREARPHLDCLETLVRYVDNMIPKIQKSAFLVFIFNSIKSGEFDCVFVDSRPMPVRLSQNSLPFLGDALFVGTDFDFLNDIDLSESGVRFSQQESAREMIWYF